MQNLFKKILKRFISLLLTLFISSFFVFNLISFSPGNDSDILFSEDVSLSIKEEYSLKNEEGNIVERYFTFIKKFFTFKWGETVSGSKVKDVVFSSFKVTLFLTFFSLALSVCFSLTLSSLAVIKNNGLADRSLSFLSYIFASLPSFLISLVLILLFSFVFPIFPSGGYNDKNFLEIIRSFFLPVLSLSIIHSSVFMRQSREVLYKNEKMEFSIAALAKGVRRRDLPLKVLYKPSAPFLLNLTSSSFSSLLGGTIVVESIFSLPGVGSLLLRSVFNRDTSTTTILIMIVSFFVSFSFFVSDILSYLADPRLRGEE